MIGMMRSKVEAFFKEFAFLANFGYFFTIEMIGNVQVLRLNVDYLVFYPGWLLWEHIFLLDKEGSVLLQVGVKWVGRKWYDPTTWLTGRREFHETIEMAMNRLGLQVDEVTFILMYLPSEVGRLRILKIPKGYTLGGWLEALHEKDGAKLKEEQEQIDKV